ncbi:peptidylprolyl isomerase [Aureispira anguillae]|uniref:Periplasmic chaperone PpiD n=1 Tax=Aureispira anguillae TaxID=2864201 RepID=A0A915YL65_9BACT|nr:peptidylprolyl isomerase [Aureispira anguillae]BDS15260.1 peptidylprolyl isomerase [Aureispira anguillae]
MALLGTIRNRFGWMMMALVFIGVASFLFMDISPGANTASGRATTVGFVNDDKVSGELVQQYTQEYQGGRYLTEEIQAQVWERIIGEKLLTQKTMAAGMIVTPTEMGDLFLSPDPRLLSPVVVNRLGDPQTRQVNSEQVRQAIDMFHNTNALLQQANGDPQQKETLLEQQRNWLALEKSVKVRALQDKYFKALESGMYTPAWMVEMEHKTQETGYNFDYVRIPYTNIKAKVEVSDQEMKDYIAAHPRLYKREATAAIDYIVFDVKPTSEDSTIYFDEMAQYAKEFAATKSMKEDSTFIQQYYGTFAPDFYTESEMSEPKAIVDSVFAAEEGTVFGPYINNQKYKVLKKIAEKRLPDSVKARHILIRAQNPEEGQAARILLDSLKNVLDTDPTASFDSLAAQFSQDGSRDKGGDLGWKAKDGSFVPQFEEYMFYTGEKDSLRILYTQFGLHLIQVTGYKYETDKVGVRIAVIEKDIIPSEGTTEQKQREVLEFITNNRTIEDMKKAAKEMSLTIAPATGLEEGGFEIIGLGKNSTAADIIRWAHNPETENGEVTNRPYFMENEQLNYTEKFVVTALVSKLPKGLASIDDPQVRGDVGNILRNEKKTAMVKSELASLTSLDAIAGKYGIIKESAANVQYGSANVGTVGVEPKVAALAAATEVGQMSGAVGGNEGVYVLQVTSRNEAPAIVNLKSSRDKVSRRISQVISTGVYDNMKDNADIVDDRSKY